MALKVSMTGTGTIGDIAPGWSVSEFTNSNTIGETSAGTGSVSFNARSTDDSLLVINNDTVSTVNDLGVVHGIVQSVNQTGLNASITHGTVADRLNLDVQVQAVADGGPKAWCSALEYSIGIGPNPYTNPISYLPSFAVNGASFGFFRSVTSDDFIYPLNQFLNYSNGYPATPTYDVGLGSLDSTQGAGNTTSWNTLTAAQLEDIDTLPSWFTIENTSSPFKIKPTGDVTIQYMVIQFCILPNASTNISIGLQSDDSNGTTNGSKIISLDGSLQRFGWLAGADYVDYSTLNQTKPLMFTIVCGLTVVPSGTSINTRIAVTDYTNTKISEGLTNWNAGGDPGNVYIPYHRLNATDIQYFNFYTTTKSMTGNPAIIDYVAPLDLSTVPPSLFDFSGYTGTSFSAYPATSGVAWELLQQLASAENFEISLNEDTVIIRDVGAATLDVSNFASPPTINPQSTLSGRQININYSDAQYIAGTVYDAQADGNNIISVEAGTTTVTSVKYDVSPLYVNPLKRYLATGTGTGAKFTGPLPNGTYFVVDSTGLPISENQWEDYGASISVNIDPEDNSAIKIILTGPYVEIPSTTGPYSLEANDGQSSFAALKISGSGVYSGDGVLGLITGIDTQKYTRATVNTISNPFITNQEQAYDRGIWASMKASGPVVSVNFAIPTSSINGIGLTCGSLFDYNNSTYRVISCTIGALSVSIYAERHALVSDVDAIWSSQTVSNFDAVWGSLECQDQIIFPYKVA